MRTYRWLIALAAIFFLFSGTAAILGAPAADKGDEVRSLLHSVAPDTARPGDRVVAGGEKLTDKYLAELYLTNGKDDIKVEILKQTETEVTFKVPPGIKGGFRLMILTAGADPKLVEQPVRLLVE
jgi:hypothetical protein